MNPKELPEYRWPNLSSVERQYIVQDDQGRVGIGVVDHRREIIWVRPAGTPQTIDAPANLALPSNAILMTPTCWDRQTDGTYTGWWFDDKAPASATASVPEKYIRRLVIIDDLGWNMPDWVADQALAGSDQMGAWNYGAKLGKVGGEPPVKGQKPGEMTVEQAEDYSREVGGQVTRRGIRQAAKRGYIPGARKIGRDWLITYDGFNHYLDNRPKRGRQPVK